VNARDRRTPCFRALAASHGLSPPHGLTADVVDRWLAGKSGQLSTDTLACSLLSSSGVPIEDIAHLMGHAATNGPEKVYRRELRFRRGVRRPLWMPFHDPRFGPSDWQLTGKAPMWRSTGSRRKRHLTGVKLVGDTGFEPVTSSVSGKRAPAAPIARGGDGI
jgi:hypothetical protein